MFNAIRSTHARRPSRNRLRAWLRSALIAGLGIVASNSLCCDVYAQDVYNAGTKSLQTNAIENANGDYNNLSTGVLNFNGPSGAAQWSAQSLVINNEGAVNLYRADLGIIGDVTNTGSFQIANLGGIVQVDGHFTNSGTTGVVQLNGGGMELIGDFGTGTADFTNSSTAATGVTIGANRFLVADTIENAIGATMSSAGRIEGRNAIVNYGTIRSNAATSVLKGTITNNGTIEARGTVEGNVTNSASTTFAVTGNLAQTGDFTNAGALNVTGGNLTGTDELTNASTITIANDRTLSAADISNNSGGNIALGNNALLTSNVLANKATITVGSGSTVRSTSTTTDDDLHNSAAGTISFNGATGASNLSSGTGKIVNEGIINLNAGTVLVTGNLTESGIVNIANGATFKSGSANQTIANAMTLAGTSTFDSNGFDATISGNIAGAGGLTKSGLGDLTLDGNNTYSGATAINGGQLTLTGGSAVKDTSALTVGAAGKLKVDDNEKIGSLSGAAGSESNLAADLRTGGNNSDTTYSGKIAGAGKLIKEGTGTMTLDGASANTLSGSVIVENGKLVASTNEQLGTGLVSVGPNGSGVAGTLDISAGTTQTVDQVEVLSESKTIQGKLNNSGTLTSNNKIYNTGTINNQLSSSVINGGIENDSTWAVIDNNGTIHGGVVSSGIVENGTVDSIINGGLQNLEGKVNNTGTIHGGVENSGTLNSNTATSIITGGLANNGIANLRNQVSGEIVNEYQDHRPLEASDPLITVEGDLVGDSTLINMDTSKLHVKDGNFTGITTLTNQSTNAAGIQIDATRTLGANAVTNATGSTIVNSGTLQSGSAINNSGTITNNVGAIVNGGINNAHPGALVTNNGTVNNGITQNFGTVNSIGVDSVINGGVNNSGNINAQNRISGAIVNNAQHTFADVTLAHAQTNATGAVTFGSGASAQTFSLVASSGRATGAEGNGEKNVIIVFDADSADVGTSNYDPDNDSITVYVADVGSTTVQTIQDAINNGSGFTASGGTLAGTVTDDGISDAMVGGRDSGSALIRVLADAAGSVEQNRTITIINDNTIASDSAIAAIDSTSGNIAVRVNGDVGYGDIAQAIDGLSGFNASVALSMGDQDYITTIDTPPTASTLTNGIFNVEGNLAVDNTFTNGGHLNLNNGDLTGVTTFTNSGEVMVEDGFTLQGSVVNNTAGNINLGVSSTLRADTLSNNANINVDQEGKIIADGSITNEVSGAITFGLGATATNDRSELYSGTNSIVNDGLIDIKKGALLATGDISGAGTIAMGDGTTFVSGSDNQSITNSIALADDGTATFDTNGNDATVSGVISGDSEFTKAGAGELTLNGANTFSGPAVIDGGGLNLQGGQAIADSTAVQLNTGTLNVGSAETIGSLSTEAGTQTNLDATLTTGGNNYSTTSLGLIAGAGGLIKQGTGTMMLDGSSPNTYGGGTTVSGGTLIAATDEQLGSGNVNVGAGANLSTGYGTVQSVAGLANQGTVSLGNSSTLNIGSSHFNNSGTVNVGTSGSVVDSGTITNLGTINFAGGTATLSSATNQIVNTGYINLNAGTVLVQGNVSGNGTINMNNGTTLRSGSANQQIANGIRVNTGNAVIDTNGNYVNLTGTIEGNGTLNKVGTGTLTWVGVNNGNALVNSGVMVTSTQSQRGNVQITNGSGVVFDQNSNGTYAGNVTGDGTLTKSGSGNVTMTGNSNYSGGTNVLGGSLLVGSHGTGQIQSNVNIASGATLGGGGTVVGNVTSQSGGRIAAGNSIGTLNVSGNLNAANSTVTNELNGTSSDLINVSGTANITGARLENQFDPAASYTTRMYRALNATNGLTGQFASVRNVNAPENALVSTYYTPTSANVVLTSLADATLASSTSTALLSTGQDYMSTIMTQLNAYQFGGLGWLAMQNPQRSYRNVWFKGVGIFNDVNAVGVLPGYSANTGGGIVGIDQLFGENTRLGVAGGYTSTDLSMANAARANATIDSARLNLYGAHSFEWLTFSAIGGYGYHDVDSKRNLSGIGTARGSQSQDEASLNFQLMVNPQNPGFAFLPYAGVQWVHLSQDAFTEQGTPGFDMLVRASDVDSLRPYVGMVLQRQFISDAGLGVTPYLFSRYSLETIMDSNESSLSINNSNFLVSGVRPNRSIVGLGGGINAQFGDRMDWFLSYNVDLGDRGTNQNAGGGLGFKF